MIKVIEITKHFRNGEKKHKLIVATDENEYIDDLVGEWCAQDSSGQNYGYRYEWKEVTDESELYEFYKEELKNVDNKLKMINTHKFIVEQKMLELSYTYRKLK